MSASKGPLIVVPIQCCLGDVVTNWSSIDFMDDLITIKVNYPNVAVITLVMEKDIESVYVCRIFNHFDKDQTNGFYTFIVLNSYIKLTGPGVDESIKSIAIKMSLDCDFLPVVLAFPQQVKPKLMSPAEALNKFKSAEIKVSQTKLVPVVKVEEQGHDIAVSDYSLNPHLVSIGNIPCEFEDVRMCGDFINFVSIRPKPEALNPLSQERLMIKIPVTEVSNVIGPANTVNQSIFLLPTKDLCDKLMSKMRDLVNGDQWYCDTRVNNGKVRFIVIKCKPEPQILRSFVSLLKSKGRRFVVPIHHHHIIWDFVTIPNEEQNNNVGADVQIFTHTVVKRIKSEPLSQIEIPE